MLTTKIPKPAHTVAFVKATADDGKILTPLEDHINLMDGMLAVSIKNGANSVSIAVQGGTLINIAPLQIATPSAPGGPLTLTNQPSPALPAQIPIVVPGGLTGSYQFTFSNLDPGQLLTFTIKDPSRANDVTYQAEVDTVRVIAPIKR